MAIPHPSLQDDSGKASERFPLEGDTGKPKKSGWLWLLVILLIAGGAIYYYKTRPSAESTS